jgi:uncharacterized protein YgiM (DUF1202 family)
MTRLFKKIFASVLLLVSLMVFFWSLPTAAAVLAQAPTIAMATVTGTPSSPLITVRDDQDQINVRSGPGTTYPKVGVLLAGQQVPAKGRTSGGDWILVDYAGVTGGTAWVFSQLVILPPAANLPIVEPPATPTPLYTATIDPTLAAEFVITTAPTRLPSFTPPPALTIPTYAAASSTQTNTNKIPMGLVIISIAAIGIILGLFSLSQSRS